MSTDARVDGVRPPGIPRESWLRRKTIKSEAARRVKEMTDNRTNEQLSGNPGQFTEAQVEAAAKEFERVWDENIDSFDPEQHDAMSYIKTAMRAALVAAQGAAPQAEQATYLNVAHSSVLAGSINARRAAREVSAMQLIDAIYDPDEDDANDSVRYGYVLEQFERLRIIYADLDDPDTGPAPVSLSSGVDEDALAEVRREAGSRALYDLAKDIEAIEIAARDGMNSRGGPYPWNAAKGVRDLLHARAAEYRKAVQ